jgi:hypothetical protein
VVDEEPRTELGNSGRRHERPEDWGWHAEWGRWARAAGWLCAGLLILLNFTWHYSRVESAWLISLAVLLVLLLLRDYYRRKNAWRE